MFSDANFPYTTKRVPVNAKKALQRVSVGYRSGIGGVSVKPSSPNKCKDTTFSNLRINAIAHVRGSYRACS